MSRVHFAPDLDLEGLSPDEAFSVLGNEIRLEIIRVLWRANAVHEYDDGSDVVETLSYSRLKQTVGVEDNGKFNYHLSRLDPYFIRRCDDGYRLSGAGKQIARTVIAISGPEYVEFSAELEVECPLCGAGLAATYEDQWLRIECTECDGLFGDQAPAGTLFLTSFPAAGFSTRDPARALEDGLYRCALDITYLMHGICRECAGHISSSVRVCDAHDSPADQHCAACGTPFPVWADMRCETCGFAKCLPVEMFVTGLSMATGMVGNQAIGTRSPSFDESIDLLQNSVETSVSTEPFRVSITIETEPRPFRVTVDDEMNLIGCEPVDRSADDLQ